MSPLLVSAFRLALAAALAAVTWLALAPLGLPMPGQSDKIAHGLAFLLLAFLSDHAFPRSRFGPAKILPLLAYGLALELVQSTLSYRYGSLADWLADTAGVLLYIPLIPVFRRVPLLAARSLP